MRRGMATTTTQAPSTNLVSRKMTVATAVTTAPRPLMGPGGPTPVGRVRRQWTTRPAWDSVKPMKTPMANRGIRVLVLPSTATSRSPESQARTPTPLPKTSRLSRTPNRWGR